MRFWDSSAIVPLLVAESSTDALLRLVDDDQDVSVWWAASVECVSALSRRERSGDLATADVAEALRRLRVLAASWSLVLASDQVRSIAERVLRVHPLRATDALQLAAAVVASEREPSSLPFVCLDERLADAAAREGFEVVAG